MKASIIVQNLKCSGCAATILNRLEGLKELSEISVDLDTAAVHFSYSNTENAIEVKEVLASLGYPSIDSKNPFKSKARSYFSCAVGKISK